MIELEAAKSAYESVKMDTLSDRVSHVIDSAFKGRRIVIFSGGAAKDKASVIKEITELKKGGSYGSIIGRNVFQRPKAEALALLEEIMNIYKS